MKGLGSLYKAPTKEERRKRKAKRRAVLDFVNFRKAFDSVSRERLFDMLSAYGVPQDIIKAIRVAYTNTTAQVITEDGNAKFFSIEAGVLQEDTLAPYLFIIIIDYVMRASTKNREKILASQ